MSKEKWEAYVKYAEQETASDFYPTWLTDDRPGILWAASRLAELEQQVSNLEEYMLKGVAFRDELQSRVTILEEAIKKIYTTQIYEDRKKELGVSEEMVGAIIEAAEKAGCRI